MKLPFPERASGFIKKDLDGFQKTGLYFPGVSDRMIDRTAHQPVATFASTAVAGGLWRGFWRQGFCLAVMKHA
jgi:hypothetical protein